MGNKKAKKRTKAVIIASGGMDSTTLLYDIIAQGYEVYALSINYNQKHFKELDFIRKTCKKLKIPHKIIDLSRVGKELLFASALTSNKINIPEGNYKEKNMRFTVVPNRNMIFLSLASGYAISLGAKKVFYGAHAGDHALYPDCRKKFVQAMRKAISLAHWGPLELEAPYLNLSKSDITKKGKTLGVDYALTWSCYQGREKACGKCGTCQERLAAFKKISIKDPLEYES
ncbi:MAG: 7-cyano-7-deazaguanine synthase QueC [Candidatus Omnitrophota bacterium]